MARLIKETPVLTGKDAERFLQHLYVVTHKVYTEEELKERSLEKERRQKNYEYFQSISTFKF